MNEYVYMYMHVNIYISICPFYFHDDFARLISGICMYIYIDVYVYEHMCMYIVMNKYAYIDVYKYMSFLFR
jgi:hypothetical protein